MQVSITTYVYRVFEDFQECRFRNDDNTSGVCVCSMAKDLVDPLLMREQL